METPKSKAKRVLLGYLAKLSGSEVAECQKMLQQFWTSPAYPHWFLSVRKGILCVFICGLANSGMSGRVERLNPTIDDIRLVADMIFHGGHWPLGVQAGLGPQKTRA